MLGKKRRQGSQYGHLVLEFIVIFAGVTLSFLADGCREQQGQRDIAVRVLEGIASDLRTDIPIIMDRTESDSLRSRWTTWLIQRWDDEKIPLEGVNQALSWQHRGSGYSPIRSSYDSAKSAGSLTFIENELLLNEISKYYEQAHGELKNIGARNSEFQFEVWRAWGPFLESKFEPGNVLAREMVLAASWGKVQHNRELQSVLTNALFFSELTVTSMKSIASQSEHLLALIEAELENH